MALKREVIKAIQVGMLLIGLIAILSGCTIPPYENDTPPDIFQQQDLNI